MNSTRSYSAAASIIAAYSLFSLAAPLTKFLMLRGQDIGIMGGDAISFCNLLFLGNLAAACLPLCMLGFGETRERLRRLSPGGTISLVSTSCLAVFTPAAFFFAIESTEVTNVIFISRAGPVFYAASASVITGRMITRSQWWGYGFIVVAITVAVFVQNDGELSRGDGYALIAAASAALVSLTSYRALDELGLEAFVLARNLLSAVGFAAIALWYFGPTHFGDLVQPPVLVGVSIYGFLVVGLAQLFWYHAMGLATPRTIGAWSFISPLVAMLATIVLLHEQPSPAQWIALVIVMLGMAIASRSRKRTISPPAEASLAAAH
ncbi:MAG: DMT family transporter [Planctomycetota bacterium]